MSTIFSEEMFKLSEFLFGSLYSTKIYFSLILFTIIGMVSITYRYILNWQKLEEKREWQDLDMFSKIILSFSIGFISFFVVSGIYYAFFMLLFFNSTIELKLSPKNVTILLLLILYPLYFLNLFKSKEEKGFENIKFFCLLSIKVGLFCWLIGINAFIIQNGMMLGFNQGEPLTHTIGWIIMILFIFLLTCIVFFKISEFLWNNLKINIGKNISLKILSKIKFRKNC